MPTGLVDAKEWAREEFAAAELGDRRRTRRLQEMATSLADRPNGTLPASFPRWAELKAAYRLLENRDVTYGHILEPHQSRVRDECRTPGEYLMVEDTTELDLTSAPADDLGPLDEGLGRGMYLHSTLCLRIHGWSSGQDAQVTLLGLAAQRCWMRAESSRRPKKETGSQKLTRPRESQRWAAAVESIGPPPAGVRYTYVADRESDVYEVLGRCRAWNWDFIIRANQPRAVVGQAGSVFDAVARAEVLGTCTLDLRSRPQRVLARNKKTGKRTRVRKAHGQRTVELEVRACVVALRAPWRPGEKLSAERVRLVEAKEIHPRPGDDPIHWVLITSWACETLEQVMRVVKAYRCRWLIEEYHKVLKTGARIEQTQLTKARRIEALLALLAVVSVRLLNRKLLARTCGQQPVDLEDLSEEVLLILEAELGRPVEGWTNRSFFRAIARLGGFIGRKSDGEPGWITIWRGWDRLIMMARGFDLAGGKRCG
jgi:hypothetical protein